MNILKKCIMVLSVLGMIAVAMTGCSGGVGDDGVPATNNDNTNNGNSTATTLAGVAAAGTPIIGMVNVKGANGATASATIKSDGTYSLDVSALTANYILCAEGTVNGKSVKIYSAAVEPGNINITPITDLIVANAYRGLPGEAFTNWNGTQVNASSLSAAQTQVLNTLAPLLVSAGVSTTTNLMTAGFAADGTGIDKALDYLSVTYNGTTVTVTNKLTNGTMTIDVDSGAISGDLSSSSTTTPAPVLSDAEGINVFWSRINTLWASAPPSQAVIDTQVKSLFAAEMLDSGEDSTMSWGSWTPDKLPVGITFSAVIDKLMDTSQYPTGKYSKAYWVRVSYRHHSTQTGSFIWSMVYDGTKWLSFGDQRWVGNTSQAFANYSTAPNSTSGKNTGFFFNREDRWNYAYNHGVRSAVVTGPGLPAGGVKMELTFPDPRMHWYQPVSPSFLDFYIITNDTTIGAIPDNSTYTTNFYTQEAGALTGSETPIHTFSDVIPKRPYKNSELSASLFPTFTSVSSHTLAAANVPGQLNVAWTNPADPSIPGVNQAEQYCSDNSGNKAWYDVDVAPGATSSTIDTRSITFTPTFVNLSLWYDDVFMRRFSYGWQFSGGAPSTVTISGMMTSWTGTTSVPVPGLTVTARHPADVDNSDPIAQTTSGVNGSYSLMVPYGSDLYLNVSGSSGGTPFTPLNSRIFRNLTQSPDMSNAGDGLGTMKLSDMNDMLNSVTYNGSAYSGGIGSRAWILLDAFDAATMSNKIAGVTFSGTPSITYAGYNDNTGSALVSPPTLTATVADTGLMTTSSAVGYNTSAVIVTGTANKSGSANQTCELPLVPGEVTYKQFGF